MIRDQVCILQKEVGKPPISVAARTNLIPSHSCKPLVEAIVNHSQT